MGLTIVYGCISARSAALLNQGTAPPTTMV